MFNLGKEIIKILSFNRIQDNNDCYQEAIKEQDSYKF